MPVCGRLEHHSVSDAGLRLVAVPHRNARSPVGFARVLGRLLSGWTFAEREDGAVAGHAPSAAGRPCVDADTILYLLETSVTIEDGLEMSHALRLHDAREPETGAWVHSDIGKLVRRAKSYDSDRHAGDRQAATRLADEMLWWIEEMPPYCATDVIVPAPSTNPDKTYDLPSFIAKHLASRMSKEIATIQSSNTSPQKNLSETEKASAGELARYYALTGDIEGKSALIIDDIYESGATVGAMAQVLRSAGALRVLSLTATKAAKGCQGLTPSTDNWPMEV